MAGEISDEIVRERTGRAWAEWFALLDRAGAAQLERAAIVALLKDEHGVDGWWVEMVTLQYERARGKKR